MVSPEAIAKPIEASQTSPAAHHDARQGSRANRITRNANTAVEIDTIGAAIGNCEKWLRIRKLTT